MGDLSVIFSLFKTKIMFKSHLVKSNHRTLRKNLLSAFDVFYIFVIRTYKGQTRKGKHIKILVGEKLKEISYPWLLNFYPAFTTVVF